MADHLHSLTKLLPSRLDRRGGVRTATLLALLALLAAAGCTGGGRDLEPRYSHFSVEDAVWKASDVPAGWQLLSGQAVTELKSLLPKNTELADSAVIVATNGGEDPAVRQVVAIGVALLDGDAVPAEQPGLAGLALRAVVPDYKQSKAMFLAAQPVDSPAPGSTRLQYSYAVPGAMLVTDAINIRDGRVLADVELLHPNEAAPALDLDQLAALIYSRIAPQLQGP